MAYEFNPEPGEVLIEKFWYRPSEKHEPLALVVSNQAVYLPSKKLVAVRDPYFFRRVLHSHVNHVTIRDLPPYKMWLLSIAMVISGLFLTYLVALPFLEGIEGKHSISPWPPAIVVGGLLVPFAARKRPMLQIDGVNRRFRWKPPLIVGTKGKSEVDALLSQFAEACRKGGLTVRDDRKR